AVTKAIPSASQIPLSGRARWSVRRETPARSTTASREYFRYRARRSYMAGLRLRRDRDLLQEVQLVQHLARPERHTRQRVIGDGDGEIGLLPKEEVQAFEESAAAGEDDTLVDDVGGQLGRRALEGGTDGVHDGHDRLAQRLADLVVADHDRLGDAVDQVAPLHLHGPTLGTGRVGRAEP